MRLIKGFILAVAGLFIVTTLFSLLMPSSVITVRSVVIHAEAARVYAEIADLNNWKNWHPVFMQVHPPIKISSPSSGVNANAQWISNGKKNKILIAEAQPANIKMILARENEKDGINYFTISALPESNNVQVEWKVLTKLKWVPWEKFSGIFVDKMTGPGYEEALNNLKEFIENKQKVQ